MFRFGWIAILLGAASAWAQELEPLASMKGLDQYQFGLPPESFQDLLPWGQADGLDVFVADFKPVVLGVTFETRVLRFYEGHLAEVSLVTTDLEAGQEFLKRMARAYGKAAKLGDSGYEWRGSGVLARYQEADKVASVTYASVEFGKSPPRPTQKPKPSSKKPSKPKTKPKTKTKKP